MSALNFSFSHVFFIGAWSLVKVWKKEADEEFYGEREISENEWDARKERNWGLSWESIFS